MSGPFRCALGKWTGSISDHDQGRDYTEAERRYLLTVARLGRPASREALALLLGVDPDRTREVEIRLVRCGLIDISSKGRAVTDDGRKWLSDSGGPCA